MIYKERDNNEQMYYNISIFPGASCSEIYLLLEFIVEKLIKENLNILEEFIQNIGIINDVFI